MNNLHPVFENIFKTTLSSTNARKSFDVPCAKSILDYFNQDISFDNLETLRGFINEIKEHPLDVILAITTEADKLEMQLVENDICPLCGNTLTFEHDTDCDNYVPYGDIMVKESDGGTMVCECCGYRSE